MKKKALIFGVTGQDGAYLAKFLLKKNYVVHGVKRRASSINTIRVDDIYLDLHDKKDKYFFLHYGDLSDSSSILNLIKKIKPNEIYNLAAQSHVAVSFELPEYTSNINALGALRILEAIRSLKLEKIIKFYQAGTSECSEAIIKLKMKIHHFTLKVLMVHQNFLHIGLQKIIESPMIFLRPMEFYLIMKAL